MDEKNYRLIIVGGGAAGLMAAVTAADCLPVGTGNILLIEKNGRVGKKLLITGKGRCNVTNSCGREEFFENIPTNPRFLYSAFSAFSNTDVMGFFEGLGVPLKVERGSRVFPVSDRAEDIVAAFERALRLRRDRIEMKNAEVTGILTEDDPDIPGKKRVTGVRTSGENIYGNAVLIAAGGASYPGTGSDGSGYRLAGEAGHTVIPLRPSLVPLVCREDWCRDLMGLSLKNVVLTLRKRGSDKKVFSELGEMLFTHFGVSGPLVLSASGHMNKGSPGDYFIEIDLKPALDEKKLDERLQRDLSEFSARDFSNSLGKLLPRKLIPVIVRLSGIPGDRKANEVTREERRRLGGLLKCLTLNVKDFRPLSEAIVTGGGVKVSEIDPKTMGSKLIKGLYFAGEVIDVDAYTGGFNLQIAFSTGAAAGKAGVANG